MGKRSVSWKPFWLIFPGLALLPIGVLAAYAVWSVSGILADIRQAEALAVDLEVEAIARDLDRAVSDVCVLAAQNELGRALTTGDPVDFEAMAREYRTLALNARTYDQIRFVDATGMERVRINHTGLATSIVPAAALQDKSSRYYVADTLSLSEGEVYVSPLDLNIENGEIELPYKPMIRLGTPVAGPEGEISGAVIINYRAQAMLLSVAAAGAVSIGHPMMLNGDGYWLVTPNPPPGWGFMFEDRMEDRMETVYPEAWAAMQAAPRGSVRTDAGLFTFEVYQPLKDIGNCPDSGGSPETAPAMREAGYTWILASHVPASVLSGIVRDSVITVVTIGVPMLLLLALGTRAMMIVVVERKRHRTRLETLARTDALTGLANRIALEDRLDQEIHQSNRHGRRFALVYIDLDGFKAINDAAGHAAGDQVLVDIARTLERCCRRVDLVARCGGDEFVVLLSEVSDEKGVCGVAEKMLAGIKALSWDGRTVGASIGIALWPDHAGDSAGLMRVADEAMYAVKKAGKGTIRVA